MTRDRKQLGRTRFVRSPAIRVALALGAFGAALAVGTVAAQPRSGADPWFERLDTNGDGVIERDEFEASRRSQFERADADGDGYLSDDELRALPERGGMGGRGHSRGRRWAGRMPDVGGQALARHDTDGDGRLSAQEFLAAESPMLRRLDTDRDGRITRQEAESAQARAREHMRPRPRAL
ncbi:MAG TPA: hypothetical protein VIN61_08055 [Gammaproteobacteria bacterium]